MSEKIDPVELIEFKYPKAGTKLRLPRIVWNDSEQGLIDLLREEFSKFGLLYQVEGIDGHAK